MGVLLFIVLAILIVINVPIAIALGVASVAVLVIGGNIDFSVYILRSYFRFRFSDNSGDWSDYDSCYGKSGI